MLTHDLGRTEFGKPENKGNLPTLPEAIDLLNDWVKNDRLRLHMYQVAKLMKCWAKETEHLSAQEQLK